MADQLERSQLASPLAVSSSLFRLGSTGEHSLINGQWSNRRLCWSPLDQWLSQSTRPCDGWHSYTLLADAQLDLVDRSCPQLAAPSRLIALAAIALVGDSS